MTSVHDQELVRSKRGRPRIEDAGLAEERVLDAATALFLEQGFGRTTLDKVSQLSKTGKSALYGRYPNKESLFAAVVHRSIEAMFAEMATTSPDGDVTDRLRQVGIALAESLLVPRCVALMRITAAEAGNFPDLARMAYQVSFEGSVRCVAVALLPGASDAALAEAAPVARRFVEVALQPLSFQAAFGGDIDVLREQCLGQIDDAIVFLRAKGWLQE